MSRPVRTLAVLPLKLAEEEGNWQFSGEGVANRQPETYFFPLYILIFVVNYREESTAR